METPQLIPIELIDPNPYQPREHEDPETVAEIAASIQRNGLAQIPSARPAGDRYQLAFGHTRKAAFVLNGETHMPLFVRDFDDQQMFELGVAENVRRRDLNPIELARAMKVYMEKFNKTSRECGEFFDGASPEKVRSTVRLLNLPRDLQAGVADGTITQNNARRLLTIQRVAPDKLKAVVNKLDHRDADPDKVIGETLTDSSTTVKMWERWQSGHPLAGNRLWGIYMQGDKFPNDLLPELKAGELARALGIEKDADLEKWIDALWDGYWHGSDGIPEGPAPGVTVAEHFISRGAPVDVIEKISHLLRPPGCRVCPFYAKVEGNHYCTFRFCHNRKTRAWEQHVIDRAVKKTSIAIYNKKLDGDQAGLSSYEDHDKKLFEDKHPDLRLRKGQNWAQRGFEGVPDGWMVVVVGETLKKMRAAKKQNSVNSQERNDNYYRDQRRMTKIRDANEAALFQFIWHVACPAFQPAVFNGSGCMGFYESFADRFCSGVPAEEPDKKASKAVKIDFYQRSILFAIFDDELWDFKIDEKNQAVRRFAKHLQGVAKTWGVDLPKDWMQKAKAADEAITVTAETAEEE